jgi:hypothetical protein
MILAGPWRLPADTFVRRILPKPSDHFTPTRQTTMEITRKTAVLVFLIRPDEDRSRNRIGVILLTFTA